MLPLHGHHEIRALPIGQCRCEVALSLALSDSSGYLHLALIDVLLLPELTQGPAHDPGKVFSHPKSLLASGMGGAVRALLASAIARSRKIPSNLRAESTRVPICRDRSTANTGALSSATTAGDSSAHARTGWVPNRFGWVRLSCDDESQHKSEFESPVLVGRTSGGSLKK